MRELKMQFLLPIFFCLLFLACKNEGEKTTDKQQDKIESVNFNGFKKNLNKNDNKLYVINFWATWCKPCVEEMPYLLRLEEEEEVELILVSLDLPKMKNSQLKPFLKKRGINSKVILLDDPNSNQWIPKVNPDWDGAIPATLIYKNDTSKFIARPFANYDELLTEVKKIM
ncbi:TlpA disulfide reductase family protein [Mesonia aquimarina]|uniref:TlpA disulfide reductase family protein n=1 Tax=Mesonia aquimarina TaxID=1504967 RepID=UPI000EF56909|nr:TlpA disulfide reductase family protein [Mesonia aquimarina]